MNVKRSVVIGATVATLSAGVGAVGLASAATDTSTTSSSNTSLVDKLATKFNLKKADVQAVVDADRAEHQAAREAKQQEKLATAVKDGKLTQEQADHITAALAEIKALRGTADTKSESDAVREQIKTKIDELKTWAKTNNVDTRYIKFGHGGGHGHGGPRGDKSGTSSNSN